MLDPVRVVIGIQARSTSKRFPNKVFAKIGDKAVLQHVIDAAKDACVYSNRFTDRWQREVSFALLIPFDDPIKVHFAGAGRIIEGPEDDVLARYLKMAKETDADYIVRVTGDCPLIPSYVITKHIKTAIKNKYDYVSNVDERLRTSFDGTDCEVISRRLLELASDCAKAKSDREHVTTWIRRCPPTWAKFGHVIGYLPMADLKLSIDTPEDLERVRDYYNQVQDAIRLAERLHGKNSVHRF